LSRSDRGSVSIEAVILIPVFLATIFLTLEGSLWVYASSVAQAAAQDGVRAGAAYQAGDDDAHRVATEILLARDAGEDWRVTTATNATSLTVTVTGRATSIVPGLSLDVHESATMPWESGPR